MNAARKVQKTMNQMSKVAFADLKEVRRRSGLRATLMVWSDRLGGAVRGFKILTVYQRY
jgi:hypothetical protein